MEMTFETLTIYYINPFYVLMTNNLYFIIIELKNFLFNLPTNGPKIAHFIMAEFSEIFAFFGYMVYLEILELNFCGLSDNVRRRLMKKGEIEVNKINTVFMREMNSHGSIDVEDDETSQSSELSSQKIN